MSERPPASTTFIKLAWCCLLASVIVACLLFPVVGGLGLMSNRASDIVANGSSQLLEGDVPAVTTMVDAKGNTIALNTFLPSRLAGPGILENQVVFQAARSRTLGATGFGVLPRAT